ncbi:hypothetical protein H310_14268 [Aphanomyces invadans]|uniref:Uncharacterized protein n=1 Tax=Aphanomyces invadans TaxID=157072 RepID=A0A024TAG5_9STRA|nr:hypothetical protein H310_14268 [Aphanomyces invadans]ETV91028.1 hypothetical protein H310_14268 [Aphanomyces invadans]|eukprot:XP_008880308.1 hypothetical protein H310_14268 [Aphanomyces invadans]
METVVSVPMPHMAVAGQDHPLPPPGPSELDELWMQNVKRAAASSSEFNKMTYELMAQFHTQQQAMAVRLKQESARQAVMVAEIENSRREQDESRAISSKQQEHLRRQHEEN